MTVSRASRMVVVIGMTMAIGVIVARPVVVRAVGVIVIRAVIVVRLRGRGRIVRHGEFCHGAAPGRGAFTSA